jgi:hypothetical protein
MDIATEEARSAPPARTAELVLVTHDGAVLGRLAAVPVSTPWWQDVEPVVLAVHERFGIDVVVLRLLEAELNRPHGGRVVYLAEVDRPVAAEPWEGCLTDHLLRQPYARPGGPKADLAWAEAVLGRLGIAITAPPAQVRTWNLSSLWRIPTVGQTVWLKVVPHFFAHEGRLLVALAKERVPRVLGHEGRRVLLAEIHGEDLYEADEHQLVAMVTLLVGVQRSWIGRTKELIALGLPDWRAPSLGSAIGDVFDRTKHELSVDDREVLEQFLGDLPRRFAAIDACGIRDTLVHGDFHPGNVRGRGDTLTLLDWGDAGIGHPLLDQPAFLDRVPAHLVGVVSSHWTRQWLEAIPGSDPARASALLAPVAAARQAVIYQRFIDGIEPTEQPYHRFDPVEWLQRTAILVRRHG